MPALSCLVRVASLSDDATLRSMVLRLEQHETSPGTLYPPFDDPTGFTDDWWHSRNVYGEDSHWWSAADESEGEIARAEVGPESTAGSAYGVAAPASGFVEIYFLEVREDCRRAGIGTEVVHLLLEAYPRRTFVAFSEEADQFWATLGWTMYLHRSSPMNRPLFVSASR